MYSVSLPFVHMFHFKAQIFIFVSPGYMVVFFPPIFVSLINAHVQDSFASRFVLVSFIHGFYSGFVLGVYSLFSLFSFVTVICRRFQFGISLFC